MSFNFGGNANNSGDKKPQFSFGGTANNDTGGTKPTFSFGAAATPASNPPTNIFASQNTTTPAGPPPTTTGFKFGQTAQSSSSNAFAGFGGQGLQASTTPAQTPAQSNTKSNFSFGGSALANTPQTATTSNVPFSFGNSVAAKPEETVNKPFSFGSNIGTPSTSEQKTNSTSNTAAPGPFNLGAKPAAAEPGTTSTTPFSLKPATSAATVANTPTSSQNTSGGFQFGSASINTGTSTSTSKPDALTMPKTTTNSDQNKGTTSTGGFSFGGLKTDDKKDQSKAGAFSFGSEKPEDKKEEPKQGGFSFGATKPDASAEQPKSGGFNFGGLKPEDKKESAPAQKAAGSFSFGTTKTEEKKEDSNGPTTSTSAAPAVASLKNKTMEDLINKWSSDLDKYSQDFQKQAKQISAWDQSLLASGDSISRLYAATVEAEQHSGKVDQALNYIENQQDELSQILDSYESQVKDITAEVGVTQPADQERDKAYAKAEQLIGELDGLGSNLGQMIDELNKSGEITSRLKEDDPLTSIIKILNSQLQSLSWIDENATQLNDKIDQLASMQQASPRSPAANKFRFGSLRLE